MVSLGKWLLYGLVGAFALSSLIDPVRAQGTVGAFSGIGGVLGNLGVGLKSLGQGAGSGAAGLLNPLWSLRDLIYGPQAGVQVQADISQVSETGNIHTSQVASQQQAIELDPYAQFTPITTGFGGVPLGTPPDYSVKKSEEGAAIAADKTLQGYSYHFKPSISPRPVAQVSVHGQSLPLSQAAISHYQALGVTVSPEVNQSVAAQNSGNATSVSSASSNYQAGAAQAAGYSLGSPRR